MSKDCRKQFTPRFPEIVNFPRCNNADIEWYVRIPANSPLVGPKIETFPEPYEEEDATLEPTFPVIDNQFPH